MDLKIQELQDISNINNNINNINNINLDTSWIQSYEIDDKKYKDFYKEEIKSINYFCIYIDANKSLIKIKKNKMNLINNTINKEQLFYILQKNGTDNHTKFKLSSILKYNITLEPENVTKFINAKYQNLTQDGEHKSQFQEIKTIDDITYEDTINILQEINALFIIYNINTTNNNTGSSQHNQTKRINIRPQKKSNQKNNKKTKRKS
jgi:hypothetical protein